MDEVCYDEKCDIWSCGCLLYELAALHPPFEATNHLSLAIRIKKGEFQRLPLRYSEDLNTLITCMLNISMNGGVYRDAKSRPNIGELLSIPQVALRIRERKLRERHTQVKAREEELRLKEESLRALEAELNLKEQLLLTQLKKK